MNKYQRIYDLLGNLKRVEIGAEIIVDGVVTGYTHLSFDSNTETNIEPTRVSAELAEYEDMSLVSDDWVYTIDNTLKTSTLKDNDKKELSQIKANALLNATIEFGGKTIKANKDELELLNRLKDHLTLKIDRKEYTESSTLIYRAVDDSPIELTRADFEDILIAGEDNRQVIINKQFTVEAEIDVAYANAELEEIGVDILFTLLDLQTMFDNA